MTEESLPVADRYKLRQFRKNINGKFDIAIVELLKNSDDSLKRIEKTRVLADYEKNIMIICKRRDLLMVVDNAEGMDKDTLNKIISYGEDTSGRATVGIVSGLFGIGLKDAVYGLGAGKKRIVSRIDCGQVISVSGGNWHIIEFFVTNEGGAEKVKYISPEVYTPTPEDLELITHGHGTIIKIFPHEHPYPLVSKLKELLVSHVRLRDILLNPERKIILRDVNGNSEHKLKWIQTWNSEELLFDEDITLPEYPAAQIHLTIHRADRDLLLTTPMHSERGILIRGEGDIHEITLFDNSSNSYTKRFYGDLKTNFINNLIEQREEILEQSRTGLNKQHDFYIVLKKKVNSILDDLIQEEKERNRGKTQINRRTKKSLKDLSVVLKEIGSDELTEEEAQVGPTPITSKTLPPSFGFIKKNRRVFENIESKVIFYSKVPDSLSIGDQVVLNMDNDDIKIDPLGFAVEEENIESGYIKFPIKVKGTAPNIEGTLEATSGGNSDNLTIKVVPKPQLKEFGFARDKYSITVPNSKNISFSAKIDNIVEEGDPVHFTSDNPLITIQNPTSTIADNRDGYFLTTITLTAGETEDFEEIVKIKAECSSKEHITEVEIKEEPIKSSFPLPDINDEKEDPEYPVEFSRRENKFWVYALHKTVKTFWNPDKQLEDIRFRIRFADLIVEQTINYIVGRKLENAGETDWTISERYKITAFKNQAHKIYRSLDLIR